MRQTNLGKFVVESKSRTKLNSKKFSKNTDLENEVSKVEDFNLLVKALKKNTKMQVNQEKAVNE